MIKIQNQWIRPGGKCLIVAEAGSNHNGDIKTAKKLITAAASCGADAIKFQLFSGAGLSSESKVQEILDRYSFSRKWLMPLKKYADQKGIMLTATPFDLDAVNELHRIRVPFYKIASCDLTYHALLEVVAKKNKPILLSVGLASYGEIRRALEVIKKAGNRKVILLHCIVEYPAQLKDSNLKVISRMIYDFGLPVGFSDHTLDTVVPALAVGQGACVVEKHFTLSRKMQGPDHPFALEPQELKTMVENIRKAELTLGNDRKGIAPLERPCLKTGRRGLYAGQDISKGMILRAQQLKALRPANEINAEQFHKVVGRKVARDIRAMQPIRWKDLR
jgi:N,N'-diacetyllegionaminate synthase